MTHPCPACGSPVARRHDTGRPPVHCSPACRTATYRARRAVQEARVEARVLDVLARVAALVPED